MSKLEDNVNEILGIEKKENSVQVSDFEQPAPVPRKIDENKTDIEFENGKLTISIDEKNSIHMKGPVSDIEEIKIRL